MGAETCLLTLNLLKLCTKTEQIFELHQYCTTVTFLQFWKEIMSAQCQRSRQVVKSQLSDSCVIQFKIENHKRNEMRQRIERFRKNLLNCDIVEGVKPNDLK